MKVYIGPYTNWIGPYQIADLLRYVGVSEERCHEIGKYLAGENNESRFSKFCNWLDSKKKRKIKIRIDNYDVWNMDSTLALIILPMLLKLRDQKHGFPIVENEDVPEETGFRDYTHQLNDYEFDHDKAMARWDWVLKEMIWAFEQLQPDNDWEAQYFSGKQDIKFVECEKSYFNEETGKEEKIYEMVKGPNDNYSWDKEGMEKHAKRIDNGLLLFGKYYRGLWD